MRMARGFLQVICPCPANPEEQAGNKSEAASLFPPGKKERKAKCRRIELSKAKVFSSTLGLDFFAQLRLQAFCPEGARYLNCAENT